MALTLEVSQKDRGESPAPAAVSARTRSRSARTRSSSAASTSSLQSHGVSPDGTIALVRDLKACIESTIDRYVRDRELLDARIWTDGVLRSLEELIDSTCDYVVLHAPEPGSELTERGAAASTDAAPGPAPAPAPAAPVARLSPRTNRLDVALPAGQALSCHSGEGSAQETMETLTETLTETETLPETLSQTP